MSKKIKFIRKIMLDDDYNDIINDKNYNVDYDKDKLDNTKIFDNQNIEQLLGKQGIVQKLKQKNKKIN
jgi:hypothetical protein